MKKNNRKKCLFGVWNEWNVVGSGIVFPNNNKH